MLSLLGPKVQSPVREFQQATWHDQKKKKRKKEKKKKKENKKKRKKTKQEKKALNTDFNGYTFHGRQNFRFSLGK